MAVRRSGPPRGIGIGTRFALAVGGGVAIMLVIFAIVLLGSAGGALEEKIDSMGVQVSRALAAPGLDGWLAKGEDGKWVARRGARQGIEGLIADRRNVLNVYLQDNDDAVLLTHFRVDEFKTRGQGLSYGTTIVFHGTYASGGFVAPVRLYRTPLLDARRQPAGWANVLVSEATVASDLSRLRTNIILLSLLVIALAVGVSFWAAGLVSRPLRSLVQAMSRITRGNLQYRSTVKSRDEVGQLADAIEHMVESLREGEEAAQRLERVHAETQLVDELQVALLPKTLPQAAGFEVETAHLSGSEGVANFYDAVPFSDGRLALVVASTSGSGALGAVLAAMSRAYLRAYLEEAQDAGHALRTTNRNLAIAMRKGLHVTCQVAVLDPAGSRATVYIAGHSAPFYACRSGDISVVHGEGLALGLDKGEVFDRRLEEVVVDMPAGTRIVMTTVGTYDFAGADGSRFGVDRFQELVRKHAPKNSHAFLNLVLGNLDAHLAGAERKFDATLVTAKRMV